VPISFSTGLIILVVRQDLITFRTKNLYGGCRDMEAPYTPMVY